MNYFKKYEREINDNKDFTYEVTKWIGVEENAPVGTLVTHCMHCVKTCHESCAFDNDEKENCYLFTKDSSGNYTEVKEALVCDKCKCPVKDHSNTGTIWRQT